MRGAARSWEGRGGRGEGSGEPGAGSPSSQGCWGRVQGEQGVNAPPTPLLGCPPRGERRRCFKPHLRLLPQCPQPPGTRCGAGWVPRGFDLKPKTGGSCWKAPRGRVTGWQLLAGLSPVLAVPAEQSGGGGAGGVRRLQDQPPRCAVSPRAGELGSGLKKNKKKAQILALVAKGSLGLELAALRRPACLADWCCSGRSTSTT